MSNLLTRGVKHAALSAKERKALPDSAFVFPDTRRYPIHDEEHARSALALVAAHGTADAKKKVRAEVKKRYPDIEQSKDAVLLPLAKRELKFSKTHPLYSSFE